MIHSVTFSWDDRIEDLASIEANCECELCEGLLEHMKLFLEQAAEAGL